MFLASRTYALKIKGHGDHGRAKGIPRAIVDSYRFERFREMLFEPHKHAEQLWALRVERLVSKKQVLCKKALSFENDKVYLCEGEGFKCLPHGHWRIPPSSGQLP